MAKKRKFYRKEKPKEEIKKLPSNSRFIPEKFNADHIVFLAGILCILVAILIVSLDLYSNYKKQKILANEKIKVLDSMLFWQSEVKKKPDYRDGFFTLALLSYQLKDFDKANENLGKALSLDPNFEKGKELEDLLKNTK